MNHSGILDVSEYLLLHCLQTSFFCGTENKPSLIDDGSLTARADVYWVTLEYYLFHI